jgi:hypothetical protein
MFRCNRLVETAGGFVEVRDENTGLEGAGVASGEFSCSITGTRLSSAFSAFLRVGDIPDSNLVSPCIRGCTTVGSVKEVFSSD